MRRLSRSRLGRCSAACAVVLCLTQAALAAEDPLQWAPPTQRPPFRQQLDDAAFERAAEQSLQRAGGIAAMEKSQEPSHGFEVVRVAPGSPAEQMRIKPGDVILAVDGEAIWHRNQFNQLRKPHPQVLIVVSPDAEERRLRIEPGLVGVGGRTRRRIETLHLEGAQRDPRWDRYAVVGLLACDDNPDAAETAWHKAVAAGYQPDAVSDVAGLAIALAQGRNDAALRFAGFLAETDDERALNMGGPWAFRAAIAEYKLELALRLVRRQPSFHEVTPERLEAAIAWHRSLTPAQRTAPPPSELAKQRDRRPLAANAVLLHPGSKKIPASFIEGGRYELHAPTGRYKPMVFMPDPPARDVEMVVRFRFAPSDQATGRFKKWVAFSFFDPDHELARDVVSLQGNSGLLGMLLDENDTASVYYGDHRSILSGANRELNLKDQDVNTLRLIRLGHQCEVYYNDRRILYAPALEVASPAVNVKSLGMKLTIESIEVVELLPPR